MCITNRRPIMSMSPKAKGGTSGNVMTMIKIWILQLLKK